MSVIPFDPDTDLKTWVLPTQHGVRTQKVLTLEVRNSGELAKRCVPLASVRRVGDASPGKLFALHWADTPYQFRTSGADPIDIGKEGRRLDVAFTFQGQKKPGCWMGTPSALTAPDLSPDYLAPGEYEIDVEIAADNCKSIRLAFHLTSPQSWDQLTVQALAPAG